MNVTVLVDFENDSVRTALEVAAALGPTLWGVRLDTSDRLADASLVRLHGDAAPTGVAPELVRLVRAELDAHGFHAVKIVASGGFDAARIRAFEAAGVPVDSYGVGSSLIRGANDFTADVVIVDGRPCAKVGRELRAEPAARGGAVAGARRRMSTAALRGGRELPRRSSGALYPPSIERGGSWPRRGGGNVRGPRPPGGARDVAVESSDAQRPSPR